MGAAGLQPDGVRQLVTARRGDEYEELGSFRAAEALCGPRSALGPVAVGKVDRLRTVRYRGARHSGPGEYSDRQVELTVLAGEMVISRRGVEVASHPLVGHGRTVPR